MTLKNKKIFFITGVSSGLGKALAETILNAGHFVMATFRKDAEVAAFNERYKGKGEGLKLDITDLAAIESTIDTKVLEHGRIDVLINNAGLGFSGAVEEATMEEVRNLFEANVFGTLKMTQAVLPSMRKNRSGHIVQISSHAGVKAFAGFGIYNASKFALEGFSEALAQEVKPLGIKVTIVEPGPFRTNFAGRSLQRAERQIEDYAETAGAFREKLDGVHNKQEGDPKKAAQIILEQLDSDAQTLRLPLGKIPLITIGMKIDSLKSDVAANREIATKAVF